MSDTEDCLHLETDLQRDNDNAALNVAGGDGGHELKVKKDQSKLPVSAEIQTPSASPPETAFSRGNAKGDGYVKVDVKAGYGHAGPASRSEARENEVRSKEPARERNPITGVGLGSDGEFMRPKGRRAQRGSNPLTGEDYSANCRNPPPNVKHDA